MTSTLAAPGIDTAASPARALVCRACSARYPLAAQHACYECFGPLEVDYDAAALARVTREQIEAGPQNLWRYAALLPAGQDPATRVTVVPGLTPLVAAGNLAAEDLTAGTGRRKMLRAGGRFAVDFKFLRPNAGGVVRSSLPTNVRSGQRRNSLARSSFPGHPRPMRITITPIDPADQGAVDAAYGIRAAADQADVPDFPPLCRRRFEAAIRHPMPGNVPVWALARLDGAPAGYLALDLPQLDNTDNATVDLLVHPTHLRRGVGRALHAHGVELLRERGRKRVIGATVAALPGGPARG
ncbi:GNAT family N-acetyltransferase, partial [Micromonospora sp. DH15]|nr:GNAT family N-acetyltransferase [Micromonospora sp. DH15]